MRTRLALTIIGVACALTEGGLAEPPRPLVGIAAKFDACASAFADARQGKAFGLNVEAMSMTCAVSDGGRSWLCSTEVVGDPGKEQTFTLASTSGACDLTARTASCVARSADGDFLLQLAMANRKGLAKIRTDVSSSNRPDVVGARVCGGIVMVVQ